jgi:small conductance mechanosensitive channel
MALTIPALAAQVDPDELVRACSSEPSALCRWVLEQTGSEATAELVDWISDVPVKIILVLVLAWVANHLVARGITRLGNRMQGISEAEPVRRLRRRHGSSPFLDTGEVNVRSAARAQTITAVLRSLSTGIIGVFTVMYVLSVLGLNLGPLLAGAGIAGVALGFGAQSMVRDYLAGFFVIVEDQYGVGDVVDLGEATGTVEQVTLRATRLRDQNGTVWHVPNGQVMRAGNKSQQWARAVLDIAVAPSADLERAALVIEEAANAVWALDEARPDVLGEPEVLGLEYLGPDAATIRMQGKTRPGAQWRVSRLLRVRIAEALVAAEIELPPSTFVRQGGTAPPR